jgi:hypothetical protein
MREEEYKEIQATELLAIEIPYSWELDPVVWSCILVATVNEHLTEFEV